MKRDEWYDSPEFKLQRLINNRTHEIIQITQQLSDMMHLLQQQNPNLFLMDRFSLADQQLTIVNMAATKLIDRMGNLLRSLEPSKFDDQQDH